VSGRGVRTPLAGRTILVTRPVDRAAALVEPLTRALKDLVAGRFTWITITSHATVEMLAARVEPGDVRARVAAIGEGTAGAFRSWAGRDVDLQPTAFTTGGLARAFPKGIGRVLCARADIAPEGLEDALAAKGWSPERVDAYRTRMPRTLPAEARAALAGGEVDAVTFTSASTVRGFVGALGAVRGTPRVVCIGPVTAKEARAHGLTVHAVANPHTFAGVVDAVERALTPRARR
jgi:uroporphyrinogen-III synthase